MTDQMEQVKLKNVTIDKIMSFIEDVLRYLEDNDSDEHETNQGLVGFRDLFRGCAVRVWSRTDFSDKSCHKLNKAAIRLSVKHYYKC